MKEKMKAFSGLIASALLIVSICSLPMTAEAQTVASSPASRRSAYSREKTGTVSIRVPTGGTVTISIPAVSREKTQTVSQPQSTVGKTVIRKTSGSSDASSASSSAASVRTVTVKTPMGDMIISVPTVSRKEASAASQPISAEGKTGSSSEAPQTSGEKTAAAPIASSVPATASNGGATSAPAVNTQVQSSKSNSSGLCLVVLGLQLKPDGSMQQELIERLEALKVAAQSNPQALIVCTGGHSAENNRAVSEAGQMAKWLRENGIDSDRILVESNGMSTQGNASYTLKLLNRYHPEVSRITIFTSDYHMSESVRFFTSQAAKMGSGITVSAGKAWKAR